MSSLDKIYKTGRVFLVPFAKQQTQEEDSGKKRPEQRISDRKKWETTEKKNALKDSANERT